MLPGDFYLSWNLCEIRLSLMPPTKNRLAEKVLETMKIRSRDLFESDGFWAALFVDPRFKFSSDDEILTLQRQNQGIVSSLNFLESVTSC